METKNEKKFYKILEDIFIGSKIEGKSGYVNLLKIKENYYNNSINAVKKEINDNEDISGSFKEELYNKLYSFFDRYFSENGSIHFVKTPNWQKIYEKIYTSDRDTILFWKTNMLYYVKSDMLFNSVFIDVNYNDKDYTFYFDVGNLEAKQNNEKRLVIFDYLKNDNIQRDGKKVNAYIFNVSYSERGKKNNLDQISKESKLDIEILNKAFNSFSKQSEIDYFINKNAKEFLSQQLEIFLNQILLEDENRFDENRLEQLKIIRKYALSFIDIIAQFEDELVKVWNKPKFVKNSNYVLSLKTLNKILSEDDYNFALDLALDLYKNNSDYKADIDRTIRDVYKQPLSKIYVSKINLKNNEFNIEYIKLFEKKDAMLKYLENSTEKEYTDSVFDREKELVGFKATYQTDKLITQVPFNKCYIDTKYLSKEDKMKLISCICKNNKFDDVIDGYLVKSDNYQFLNTVNKFNKKIDCIYIDPPFNTEGSGFAYVDKFKDSTWLSMMNDRLLLAKSKYLSNNGSLYLHLDSNCNYLGRMLMDNIFKDQPKREIIWNTGESLSGFKVQAMNWIRQHDCIYYYSKDENIFNKMWIKNDKKDIKDLGWLDVFKDDNDKLYVYKYNEKDVLSKYYLPDFETKAIGDIWNDIYSMMYSQNMTRENWGEDNTQKPENLPRRIIQASSNESGYFMDFFAGSGTSLASAHKLHRKWIGVEMGEYIERIVLPRLKSVVFGDYRAKLSEDINWTGGGIFKYYSLEQYENTLARSIYSDTQLSIFDSNSHFSKYIFLTDKKLTDFIKNSENDININFDDLYENIDIPETISNLTGCPIVALSDEEVILDNSGTKLKYKINPSNMNLEEKKKLLLLLKPLLWWGD